MKNLAAEPNAAKSSIEERCRTGGLKLTAHQRLIVRIISEARDHPDFPELYRRIAACDAGVSRPTVCRTLRLLTREGIIERRTFRDGRYHYALSQGHHDHLIDLKSGKISEFSDPEIERLQKEIARKLGYELTGHRLELYATPLRVSRRRTKR